jgi:PIN domain nuclease of toxin-antitoxin system
MSHPDLKAVFDASAVIAWIFDEPGAPRVEAAMHHAGVNAVNLAEILWKSKVKGYKGDLDDLAQSLSKMGLTIIPFDAEQAALVPFVQAAGVRLGEVQPTLAKSLSLADCTCIATALHLDLPIVGDDVLWTVLDIRGLKTVTFR